MATTRIEEHVPCADKPRMLPMGGKSTGIGRRELLPREGHALKSDGGKVESQKKKARSGCL